jgi:hypothetical protein
MRLRRAQRIVTRMGGDLRHTASKSHTWRANPDLRASQCIQTPHCQSGWRLERLFCRKA